MIASCKKEKDQILWNRSYGPGIAYFIGATADSGILAAGSAANKPYLVKLATNKSVLADYTSGLNGCYTSAWGDTSCFIAAGSSNGKLLLSRIDPDGNSVWDTTLNTGFLVERASLIYAGNGRFLAVAGVNPDSSEYRGTGLLFLRFDTAGKVILKKEITDAGFISAGNITTDNSGNIFIALTRRNIGSKSRAAVAKYNASFQKLWETELYNNPDVSSASLGIELGISDSIYVTGKTEVERTEGTLGNSFLASLGKTGITGKKKYLENSNSGSDLIFANDNRIMMLNKNCFFITIVDMLKGYNAQRLRFFSACDAYKTDAFGTDLDINFDGNIIVAGSVSNNFYLALKSVQQ